MNKSLPRTTGIQTRTRRPSLPTVYKEPSSSFCARNTSNNSYVEDEEEFSGYQSSSYNVQSPETTFHMKRWCFSENLAQIADDDNNVQPASPVKNPSTLLVDDQRSASNRSVIHSNLQQCQIDDDISLDTDVASNQPSTSSYCTAKDMPNVKKTSSATRLLKSVGSYAGQYLGYLVDKGVTATGKVAELASSASQRTKQLVTVAKQAPWSFVINRQDSAIPVISPIRCRRGCLQQQLDFDPQLTSTPYPNRSYDAIRYGRSIEDEYSRIDTDFVDFDTDRYYDDDMMNSRSVVEIVDEDFIVDDDDNNNDEEGDNDGDDGEIPELDQVIDERMESMQQQHRSKTPFPYPIPRNVKPGLLQIAAERQKRQAAIDAREKISGILEFERSDDELEERQSETLLVSSSNSYDRLSKNEQSISRTKPARFKSEPKTAKFRSVSGGECHCYLPEARVKQPVYAHKRKSTKTMTTSSDSEEPYVALDFKLRVGPRGKRQNFMWQGNNKQNKN